MATQPTPPAKPSVPPPAPQSNHPAVVAKQPLPEGGYRPTIGVKGEVIEDGERDPDTIAEEQRKRSDEMDKAGVAKWIAEHDERKGDAAAPRKVTATVQIESPKAP